LFIKTINTPTVALFQLHGYGLGETDWHLNELDTFIFQTEPLLELIRSEKYTFDHLPVLSAIERKIKIEQ